MSIKIIKHGASKFKAICPVCGCEFEYDLEDIISEQYSLLDQIHIKQVKCPDCGELIAHETKQISQTYPRYPTYPISPVSPNIAPFDPITKPFVTWDTQTITWPDCETCPNKPTDKTMIGDSACSLCIKNKPYCVSAATDWNVGFGAGEFTSTANDSALYASSASYSAAEYEYLKDE